MAAASDLIGRAILGLLIGAAAAALSFAVLLWRLMRQKSVPTAAGEMPTAISRAAGPIS